MRPVQGSAEEMCRGIAAGAVDVEVFEEVAHGSVFFFIEFGSWSAGSEQIEHDINIGINGCDVGGALTLVAVL